MSKLKVLSLFSGIGAFEKALTNLGMDFELVGFSEIDKYAIKSYCSIHNVDESLNLGDVSKIKKDQIPDFELLVGGSPCQAFSVAGHRKGFEDTRGTLFFQYIETLKHKQPKYFVFENVKGLINHDKGNTLDIIAQSFSEVGYRIDLELLNSKYFNVPQNRERIYIVGIREDLIDNEEWNIDSTRNDVLAKGKRRIKELGIKSFNFTYPKQKSVNKRLRDILEEKVDEKYYLSDEKTSKLISQLEETGKYFTDKTCLDTIQAGRGELRVYEDISPTLNSRDYKEPRMIIDGCNMLGRLEMKGNDSLKRVYDPDGMCPTLTTMGGGNTEPKIAVEQYSQGEGVSYCIDANYIKGTSPGDIGKGRRTHVVEQIPVKYSQKEGIGEEIETSFTLNASDWRGLNRNQGQNAVLEVRAVLTPEREEKRQNGRRFKEDGEPAFTVNTIDKHGVAIGKFPKYRIRKLTPLECFRLQAFSDDDYQECVDVGISNSQLYKQAGNSITVTVLESIFKELLNTYKF